MFFGNILLSFTVISIIIPTIIAFYYVFSSAKNRLNILFLSTFFSIILGLSGGLTLLFKGGIFPSEPSIQLLSLSLIESSFHFSFMFGEKRLWLYCCFCFLYLMSLMHFWLVDRQSFNSSECSFATIGITYAALSCIIFSSKLYFSLFMFELLIAAILFLRLVDLKDDEKEDLNFCYLKRNIFLGLIVIFAFVASLFKITSFSVILSIIIQLYVVSQLIFFSYYKSSFDALYHIFVSFGLLILLYLISSNLEINYWDSYLFMGFSFLSAIVSFLSKNISKSLFHYINSSVLLLFALLLNNIEFFSSRSEIFICLFFSSLMLLAVNLVKRDLFPKWQRVITCLSAHLIVVGFPLTTGFGFYNYMFNSNLLKFIFFGMIIFFLSSVIYRMFLLSKDLEFYWNPSINKRYKSKPIFASLCFLIISLEYFYNGTLLGFINFFESSWYGVSEISLTAIELEQVYIHISVLLGVVALAFLSSHLSSAKSSGIQKIHSILEFLSQKSSFLMSLLGRLSTFVFELLGKPESGCHTFVRTMSSGMNEFSLRFNGVQDKRFYNLFWEECSKYVRAISYFIRYLQNGYLRFYLVFSFGVIFLSIFLMLD